MSRIIHSLLLVFLSGYSGAGLLAQSELRSSLPYQEQVYVQLNQELFLSGDTLWAGVFILESEFMTPSQLSKVAYLEIWAQGTAVIKQRVIVEKSAAMVGIALPADLRSGIYMVRAYTRWMQNGPEAMFFRHWIRVVNPQSPPPVKEPGQQLFPLQIDVAIEGGQLIANQQHSLHVRATGWDGSRASTHGWLLAGESDTIQAFQLNERGYAKLEFLAKPATSYRLLVKNREEGFESILVGESKSTGLGMRIVEAEGESYLQIVGGEDQLRYEATLGIVERGKMRTHPVLRFRSDEGRRIRSTEWKPGSGTSQLILWDGDGKYMGSCFWVGQAQPEIEIDSGEEALHITAITTRNIGNQPISLVDYTWFLTGLPGFIPAGQEQMSHLEEVLPFEANEASISDLSETQVEKKLVKAEYQGIILEGTVKDGRGNPVPGETTYLAFPGEIAWLHLAVTDSMGLFHFVLEPEIGQPASTIIRGGKSYDPSWTITLNSGFASSPDLASWPSLTIDTETWNHLQSYYQHQQLATKYLDPEQDPGTSQGITLTTPIYGQPDYTYRFADYTTMPTEEAFIEFIPLAYIRKPNKAKTIYLLNSDREELFPGPPLLLIDGVPVVSSAEIFGVSYRLVDRIELVTRPYVLNGTFINGVLNLITYQKDASSVVLREGELRAELLIVPPATSAGNQVLQGNHVPDFSQMNEIRPDQSESPSEADFPGKIWVQSVGGRGL